MLNNLPPPPTHFCIIEGNRMAFVKEFVYLSIKIKNKIYINLWHGLCPMDKASRSEGSGVSYT